MAVVEVAIDVAEAAALDEKEVLTNQRAILVDLVENEKKVQINLTKTLQRENEEDQQ